MWVKLVIYKYHGDVFLDLCALRWKLLIRNHLSYENPSA